VLLYIRLCEVGLLIASGRGHTVSATPDSHTTYLLLLLLLLLMMMMMMLMLNVIEVPSAAPDVPTGMFYYEACPPHNITCPVIVYLTVERSLCSVYCFYVTDTRTDGQTSSL